MFITRFPGGDGPLPTGLSFSRSARISAISLSKVSLSCGSIRHGTRASSFIPMTIHTKWMELLRKEAATEAFSYGEPQMERLGASFIDGQIKLMKSEATQTW